MNYLEFAQHLRQAFQFRMRPFKFDILAYGFFEAEAENHTGRPFAFSMEAITSDITPIIGAHDGHTANVDTLTCYIVDEYKAVVGKATFVNIDDITGTCDVTLEFESAKRTLVKLDVQELTDMLLEINSRDAVEAEALVASIGAIDLRMEVEQLTFKSFTFDVDTFTDAIINIANRAAEPMNIPVHDLTQVILSVVDGQAHAIISPLYDYDQILMTFQRWRIALLSDYENFDLSSLENLTLADMEYIRLQ